jgi:flagellar motor switch protein FliG
MFIQTKNYIYIYELSSKSPLNLDIKISVVIFILEILIILMTNGIASLIKTLSKFYIHRILIQKFIACLSILSPTQYTPP